MSLDFGQRPQFPASDGPISSDPGAKELARHEGILDGPGEIIGKAHAAASSIRRNTTR